MNRYPTQFAPKSWGPKLRPWFVRLVAPIRRFKQARAVGLTRVEVRDVEHLHAGMKSQMRMLIAPNHSSHADPFTIYNASIRGRREAIVKFGAPLLVPATKSRSLVAELTTTAQQHVQSLIESL